MNNTLLTSDLNNYKFTGIYKAEIEGTKVYIRAYMQYNYIYSNEWFTIGQFDIENKEGRILLAGYKEYKWYKNLKALWNAIYKVDTNASINSYDSIQAQIKAIMKPVKEEIKEKSFIVGNRNFKSLEDAKQYCDIVDFDYSMIIA